MRGIIWCTTIALAVTGCPDHGQTVVISRSSSVVLGLAGIGVGLRLVHGIGGSATMRWL